MLEEEDYEEAGRRYKDLKGNGHERQRYHALILVTCGYSYRETAAILLVDEETASEWVRQYEEEGLDGLKNDPEWGGEHGQREVDEQERTALKAVLEKEAMPGTVVGSGWTAQAVGQVIRERFQVAYSRSGVRKALCQIGWSYQRGRKLYIQRSPEEPARFELETAEGLADLAARGERVDPLAGDQSTVYLEGTIDRRWHPIGQPPLLPDGSRSKKSETIYGAIHLGTGEEVCPLVIDWQDSDATIRWLELLVEKHRHKIVLWIDQAPHPTGDEVEEWLEERGSQIQVIHFPA